MLTQDDIKRLAGLARLELSEQEIFEQAHQLEQVLEYVGRLAAIDTTDVTETTEATEVIEDKAMIRVDQALATDDVCREIILTDFPERAGDALRVPAVFENPKGSKNGL